LGGKEQQRQRQSSERRCLEKEMDRIEREREIVKETLMNVDNKDPNLSSKPLETQRGFSAGQ